MPLLSQQNVEGLGGGLHSVGTNTQDSTLSKRRTDGYHRHLLPYWMLAKPIPANGRYSKMYKSVRRQLINDYEQWWIGKLREMEMIVAIGYSRNFPRLIRNTGP